LRVTLHDGRTIIGTFLAFDKHLNLVLSDAEEFRILRKGGAALIEERTEKRSLGLVLIRGENVVSLAVEGPPPPSVTGKTAAPSGGIARGRGAPMPGGPPMGAVPMGLGAAPVHGVGAPGMMPPPPPPPGGGMPPGMGRGMPPPY
jgi:small nuclear ribonucleoprotein B and B'